jgi:hypothetical protein
LYERVRNVKSVHRYVLIYNRFEGVGVHLQRAVLLPLSF